jgi:hypothetical protein
MRFSFESLEGNEARKVLEILVRVRLIVEHDRIALEDDASTGSRPSPKRPVNKIRLRRWQRSEQMLKGPKIS